LFRDIELGDYYKLLHPRPVVVITSTCPDGRVNAMACSWFTPISEDPPTVAVVIDESAFTVKCIEESREFAINILPAELISKIWLAGSVSGRDVDKIKLMGVGLVNCRSVRASAITESIAVIEGSVTESYRVSGSVIFIARVVAAYVREGVVSRYGWDFSKVSLPLHGWGRLFYVIDSRTRSVFAK